MYIKIPFTDYVLGVYKQSPPEPPALFKGTAYGTCTIESLVVNGKSYPTPINMISGDKLIIEQNQLVKV